MRWAVLLAMLVGLSACLSLASLPYRTLMTEMRASAERLCEERGGLEVLQPIPEWMDVVTIFDYAGIETTVPGPNVRHPRSGSLSNYQILEPVPRDEMAIYAQNHGSTAYISVAHYLSTDRIGAVDLIIENFQSTKNSNSDRTMPLHDGRLLPDRDLPNGVYRYALAEAGDPNCANFDEMIRGFESQGGQSGYQPQNDFNDAVAANGQCIAITYQGPKETYTPPGYIYHTYSDDLPDYGVGQDMDDLVDPDHALIARLRNFTPVFKSNLCEGETTDIFEHFVYR